MRSLIRKHTVFFLVGVVLILSSCALVEPEEANSSLLIGRAIAIGGLDGRGSIKIEDSLEIKIVNSFSKKKYIVLTDASGYFFIPNIEPGRYRIENLTARYEWASSRWTVRYGRAKERFRARFGKVVFAGSFVFEELPASGVNRFTPKITVSNQKRDIQKALEYFVKKFPESAWTIMAKNELQKLR